MSKLSQNLLAIPKDGVESGWMEAKSLWGAMGYDRLTAITTN